MITLRIDMRVLGVILYSAMALNCIYSDYMNHELFSLSKDIHFMWKWYKKNRKSAKTTIFILFLIPVAISYNALKHFN